MSDNNSGGDISSQAAQEAVSATTASFVTSLIVNSAVAGIQVLAFTIIRRRFEAIYEPRTYMPPEKNRVAALTNNWVTVFWQIYKSDASLVLQKNGVDAYVFIRFLRMMLFILTPIWILSWLILLPLNSVGTQVGDKTGLDQLTYGNVDRSHQGRLWGHLVLAWVFSFWIFWNIRREMTRWILIRQKYLINPAHSALAQANTILITGIDKHYLDEERLAQLFHHLPGGVKKIWLNRDLSDMVEAHDARVKATKLLEDAQVKLVKIAREQKLKREKAQEKNTKKGKKIPEKLDGDINREIVIEGTLSPTAQVLAELGRKITHNDLILSDRLVPRSLRPTHKLPNKYGIPFTGQKVDTIDWARKQIVVATKRLEVDRKVLREDIERPGTEGEKYPTMNSAFIYFHQQIAAHMAAQIVLHDQPYRMTGHHVEVAPEDVIWSNLNIDPYWGQLRRLGSYAITAGLVLFWSFPSSFVGLLSNVSGLCIRWAWLDWLCEAPSIVRGIIQGVLPPLLLALLNLLLPTILRLLARFEGIPRKTEVELSLMTRYTIFLVFNSFLIVTLASGLISAIPQIGRNPASVATILASQLPLASTFFLTYTMQQAAGAAGNLLQLITLVFYVIKLLILGGTPRSVYKRKYTMQTSQWGQQFPNSTIVAIITISYMVISPIINGLAVAVFFLSYVVYKYLYTWVIDSPPARETGGLFFTKAISHLFIGLYIQQIALCALFFLARNEEGNVSAVPQGALMVVMIVITFFYQYGIVNSYRSLRNPLPLSLAYLSYGMPDEKGHEGSVIGSDAENDPRPTAEERRQSQILQPEKSNSSGEMAEKRRSSLLPERPGSLVQRRGSNRTLPRSPRESMQDVELGNMRPPSVQEKSLPPGEAHGMSEGELREWQQHLANLSEEQGTKPPHVQINGQPEENGNQDQDGINATDYFEPDQRNAGGVQANGRNHTDFAVDAFSHPASKEPQRYIWLPEDELGLAAAEAADNRAIGIASTTRDALLNRKGKVEITGPPPDDYEATEE